MRLLSLIALLICLTAAPALAASMPAADYRVAMTSLDEIEALITETITALDKGMSQSDAKFRLPHLQDRLQWMRDTKVAAAKVDTSHTLRHRSADSQRAQCLIMRAGLMDEAFQDVMVNVSMKARGAADSALIPASAAPMPANNVPSRCGSL